MTSRKDHLVDTALRLFYRDGFHATGVDRILAEAGTAKMTLYRHFPSKQELILAVLRRQDERFRKRLVRDVERRAGSPRSQLLALFDAVGERIAEAGFRGCPFINASAEYGDPDHPVHTVAAESKRRIRAWLRELAEAAGARQPEALARRLQLLMEGAIVLAHVSGEKQGPAEARGAAEVLLAQALG